MNLLFEPMSLSLASPREHVMTSTNIILYTYVDVSKKQVDVLPSKNPV